jgi:hypothetical protein
MKWRLDVMGSILVLASSIFAVISHDIGIEINPSQLGLLMSHVINLPAIINWAIVLGKLVGWAYIDSRYRSSL